MTRSMRLGHPWASANRAACALLMASLWLSLAAAPADASLWMGPGDRTLRADLDVLEGYRVIEGPVLTWPVAASRLEAAIDTAGVETLPPHVRASLMRVRRWIQRERHGARIGYEIRVAATNECRVVGDFTDPVRDELDGHVAVEYRARHTRARVVAGYRAGNRDEYSLDGTHIGHEVGNWIIYGGLADLWWGPGWGNSVILSSNARPFPRVGIMRASPVRPRSRWLGWLGMWRADLAVGVLDDHRFVPHPLHVGMRWTSRLVARLDVGLTRVIMICGEGRPCGFDTWFDALFPFNNVENSYTGENPSNQLAGFDLRYALRWGPCDLAFYGQYFGEDEMDMWIRSVFGLFGFSVTGPLAAGGAHWRLVGEYSDTAADGIDPRSTLYNVVYEHRDYSTGYRYRNDAIGHSLDNDARLLSVMLDVVDPGGRGYEFRYSFAHLNRDGACFPAPDGSCTNTVSASAEQMNVLEAAIRVPSRSGEISLGLRFQDNQPDTPGVRASSTAIKADWRLRF